MARSFKSVADEAAATWDDDTQKLYQEASAYFAYQAKQQILLGSQLHELREARHLTQKDLESLTGIRQSEISRIERGTANPTRDTLIKLGAAFQQRIAFVPQDDAVRTELVGTNR